MSEQKINRPLSPHLQIYRPAMTMMMSIAHRLAGSMLYGVVLGLVVWLNLLAFAPGYFDEVRALLSTTGGNIVLFVALWAFCHHLCGGVRHFFWDLGLGLGPRGREWFVWCTAVFGLALALGLYFAPLYKEIMRGLN